MLPVLHILQPKQQSSNQVTVGESWKSCKKHSEEKGINKPQSLDGK